MSDTHTFDAGTMGCAEGLSQEFKRELNAVEPGDILVTVARDPIAKDDLPALARLLGHEVLSVEFNEKAEIIVTVRRRAEEE